jgi:hypothetical protein
MGVGGGGHGWTYGQTHRHLNIKKYNQRGFVYYIQLKASCNTSRESKEDVHCFCYCNNDLPGECETLAC